MRSIWTRERVLEAAAWAWVPDDAEHVSNKEYELIAYPGHAYIMPTQVAWCRAMRPAGEIIDEVTSQVRAWGRTSLHWWISGATRPTDIEAELVRRGASLVETVHVLAYDMSHALPNLAVPDDVSTELVRDERTVRASHLVSDDVWGHGVKTTENQIVKEIAEVKDNVAAPSRFSVVAYLDGEPAAVGGCTLADDVAYLGGAASLPAVRGRGTYRAVLAERLAIARHHGASLALVKGRVETSGPILRRVGFTTYGEEHSYSLDI
jgi:hypothetical protein